MFEQFYDTEHSLTSNMLNIIIKRGHIFNNVVLRPAKPQISLRIRPV